MKEKINEVLKSVIDPELGVDIVALGLIREIEVLENGEIKMVMTLTSPMCPFVDIIFQEIENSLIFAGYGKPIIELTFNPPWQASDDLKLLMGV